MFTLPSMWNLIVSTIAFSIAAWCIHRYMDEQEIPKGMTRSLSAFVLASLVSWGYGELVDWAHGSQPAAQTTSDLSQLLKAVGQPQQ